MKAHRFYTLAAALASLMFVAAAPATKFSIPGQRRTRTCAKMASDVAPLRFADGTPTGYFVRADDPSKQGSSKACAEGYMEIDAREVIKTESGMTLYFHPGGGSDHYKDRVENGQYGHVSADDLSPRPKIERSINGRSAPLTGSSYCITPTQIPADMWYKANVRNGRSGSHYATYGNPGFDKTEGRGDWTYINWSWMQDGGSEYPDNIVRGGGLVRAIARRDMLFVAANVEPIIGYSYGADNAPNGRVTAFYGRTTAGPGEGGSTIYGWLPHSYQKTGGPIVPCVRRAPSASKSPVHSSKSVTSDVSDPLQRMAKNLFFELALAPTASSEQIETWTRRYNAEADPLARMEIVTEMSRLDQSQTVAALVELLRQEKEPRVREQIVLVLGYMRSTAENIEPVCRTVLGNFLRTTDSAERLRTLEFAALIPSSSSVKCVCELALTLEDPDDNADLRFAAAESIFKLAARTKVDATQLESVLDPVKALARQGKFAQRVRAIQVLSAPGRNQQAVLERLLVAEKSPIIRKLLTASLASSSARDALAE